MIYNVSVLNKNIERLKTIKNSLQKYIDGNTVKYDFDILFYNVKDVLTNIFNAFSESSCYQYTNLGYYCYQLQPQFNQIFSMKTLEDEENAKEVVRLIDSLLDLFNQVELIKLTTSTTVWCNTELNQFISDANDTQVEDMAIFNFFNYIKRDRPLNVLIYNIHNRNTLAALGVAVKNKFYHVSTGSSFYCRKEDYIQKSVLGGSGRCMITNNAFDVVLGYVPSQIELTNPNVANPLDYEYINRLVAYAAPNAPIVFFMPVFRLTKNICSFMSKYLRDVEIYMLPNTKKICVITARKNNDEPEVEEEIFNKLRYYQIQHAEFEYKKWEGNEREFVIDWEKPDIKYFRGSLISDEDIADMYNASDAVTNFWKNQKQELLSDYHKRPLLPFNIGHLGLVLTSGCLDGIVQEDETHSHLVKGRIIKVKNKEEIVDSAGVTATLEETTSNQVEINLFLSDGTYKSLV